MSSFWGPANIRRSQETSSLIIAISIIIFDAIFVVRVSLVNLVSLVRVSVSVSIKDRFHFDFQSHPPCFGKICGKVALVAMQSQDLQLRTLSRQSREYRSQVIFCSLFALQDETLSQVNLLKLDKNFCNSCELFLRDWNELKLQSNLSKLWAATDNSLKEVDGLEGQLGLIPAAKMERLEILQSSQCEHLVKRGAHILILNLILFFIPISILKVARTKIKLQLCPQAWLLSHIPPLPGKKTHQKCPNRCKYTYFPGRVIIQDSLVSRSKHLPANQQRLLQIGEVEKLENNKKELRRKFRVDIFHKHRLFLLSHHLHVDCV